MNKKTLYFSAAELFVNVARGLLILSIGVYLYRETGNLWAFAINVCIEFLVLLVLQAFAGTCVDRYGAKPILYVSSILSVLVSIIAGFTVGIQLVVALTLTLQLLNLFKPFIRNAVFTLVTEVCQADNIEKLALCEIEWVIEF